jgi:hypothetical protein
MQVTGPWSKVDPHQYAEVTLVARYEEDKKH